MSNVNLAETPTSKPRSCDSNRPLSRELFCDLEIHIDDQSYSAHRNVLSKAFPYFETILASNLSMNVVTVERNQIDPGIMAEMLNYAYDSGMNINESNYEHILNAAKFLQAGDLLLSVMNNLCDNLTEDNVQVIMNEAIVQYLPIHIKKCQQFCINRIDINLNNNDIPTVFKFVNNSVTFGIV